MNIEVKIVKELPTKQIERFEDKTVYNTAVFTREYVKTRNGFPYLTGNLRRSEVASPVIGSNKEYSLLSGTKYGKAVYNMKDVNWTNKSTIPQWYHNTFRQKGAVLLTNSVIKALKEI